jgi:hypothetical protein
MGGGGGFACGMTCDIAVTGTAFKVTRVQGENTITWNCTLDGKDCTNTAPGRGGAEGTPVVSQAKWDGNKIVVSTTRTGQDGAKMTSTQTLSIDGGKLTVTINTGMPDAQPIVQTYTKG